LIVFDRDERWAFASLQRVVFFPHFLLRRHCDVTTPRSDWSLSLRSLRGPVWRENFACACSAFSDGAQLNDVVTLAPGPFDHFELKF
jgi:hypothetical protein